MKSVNKLGVTIFVISAILLVQFINPQPVRAACGGIVYVDADQTGTPPDGCSWATAYPTLQQALARLEIVSGTVTDPLLNGDQIWVAEGTYYPDDGLVTLPTEIRDSTFTLLLPPGGVEYKIYGGFDPTNGVTEFGDRDPSAYVTILSGDIGNPPTPSDATNNAFHVVTISPQVTNATVLDGFTITGGNTEGDGHFGGGIYISDASPTLNNLIINGNLSPTGGGGGMFIITNPPAPSDPPDPPGTPWPYYSAPLLNNVAFSNNIAERGGGLFNQNSNPILTNVKFTGNSATNGGGGGMNSQTANSSDPRINPELTNVVFHGNTATGGGGMLNSNSNAIMTNVTFSGNGVGRRGGGLLNENSDPELSNVTFYNNTSLDNAGYADPRGGGGMMNINSDPILNNVTFSANDSVLIGGDAMRNVASVDGTSDVQISNSIFWDNSDDEISSDATSTVTIVDSVVEGAVADPIDNIIIDNPKLDTNGLADNGGFTQTLALTVGSSAINTGGVHTGCASTDQRGTTRPQGAACDIGAYEFDGVTILTVSPVTGTYVNTVTLTATLESYGIGVSGKTISFTLNGSSVGDAVTDASGVATLGSVSLVGINLGVYPGGAGSGVGASFAATGDTIFKASSGTNDLTVSKANQTITIDTSAPASAINGSTFTVAATASSGLPVSYSSSTPGVCTNNGAMFTMVSGTGTCTVQYNQAGDSYYLAAPELTENVVATESPVITSADHITFNEGLPGTFTVTVSGSPTPSLSITGDLPTGIAFDPSTGVLSGTPDPGTTGTYDIIFKASNGVVPDATQNFTLTITSIVAIDVTIGGNPMGNYALQPSAGNH